MSQGSHSSSQSIRTAVIYHRNKNVNPLMPLLIQGAELVRYRDKETITDLPVEIIRSGFRMYLFCHKTSDGFQNATIEDATGNIVKAKYLVFGPEHIPIKPLTTTPYPTYNNGLIVYDSETRPQFPLTHSWTSIFNDDHRKQKQAENNDKRTLWYTSKCRVLEVPAGDWRIPCRMGEKLEITAVINTGDNASLKVNVNGKDVPCTLTMNAWILAITATTACTIDLNRII